MRFSYSVIAVCFIVGCSSETISSNSDKEIHTMICEDSPPGSYAARAEIISSTCGGVGNIVEGVETVYYGKPMPAGCKLLFLQESQNNCHFDMGFSCEISDEVVNFEGYMVCGNQKCTQLMGEITMNFPSSRCLSTAKIQYTKK